MLTRTGCRLITMRCHVTYGRRPSARTRAGSHQFRIQCSEAVDMQGATGRMVKTRAGVGKLQWRSTGPRSGVGGGCGGGWGVLFGDLFEF
jgi:hypothetical protein